MVASSCSRVLVRSCIEGGTKRQECGIGLKKSKGKAPKSVVSKYNDVIMVKIVMLITVEVGLVVLQHC
jgi:hypothetical protein